MNTTEYLNEVFGENTDTIPVKKEYTNKLPFYLVNEYDFKEGNLLGRKIVFAEKKSPGHFTPDQYKKQLEALENYFKRTVVLILPDIEAFNRNRLIQKRINFIIANKQIFIPGFAVDIKEYTVKNTGGEYLQPAAQCLILYHLQKELLNHFNYKQLAKTLDYPYLTISRAVENLQKFELCTVNGTKEKSIHFDLSNKLLWEKALPYLRRPVVKEFFTDNELDRELLYKSNINALAYYTDLNDENQLYFALYHDSFKNLQKNGKISRFNNYEGKYRIETWKYPPEILARNGYVDPLSLYLQFKENKDERIQLELKNIINQQKW